MPGDQIVVDAGSIEEIDDRLRHLNARLHAEDSGTDVHDCDKRGEVDGAKDPNEPHIGLEAGSSGAILDEHEDGGIGNGGGVVEQRTGRFME